MIATIPETNPAIALIKQLQANQSDQRKAAIDGINALQHLVGVCRKHQCTGQTLRIRALLYSAFNGKPANLNDVQTLDWELRKSVGKVITTVGCPGFPDHLLREEFKAVSMDKWFLEEGVKNEEGS